PPSRAESTGWRAVRSIARRVPRTSRASFSKKPARASTSRHLPEVGGGSTSGTSAARSTRTPAISRRWGGRRSCPRAAARRYARRWLHCSSTGVARRPGLVRVFEGPDGYRPGESRLDFLTRHGVGPGVGDPALMPRFLLLVGGPDEIPWEFQHDLALGHAVGRLSFDAPAHYARYAERVIAIETEGRETPRRAA